MSRQTTPADRLGNLFRHEPPPLAIFARRPSYPWLVVGTVCIGAFMGQADASIAQLVLPVLERAFGEPLNSISWIVVAYMLTLAALLPVFGRLADLYGRKLFYVAGFVLFIVGSGLCGWAPDLSVLVGSRVLQAIGAALLQTNSVAIVVSAVGEKHCGRAIGLQATAQAVGLSAGPAIGGMLIHALSWRWVFWLNVPFGLLGAILGWLVLPQTAIERTDQSLDWWGTLLLAPTMIALVLMINQGQQWGAASAAFLGCGFVAAGFLPWFVWRERRQPAPLLDLTLFRRHAFWAGNLAGLLSYAMLFGTFFLMPFVFARGYHENALIAGLRLAVIPVALGLVSPTSGVLYDRLGPRLLTSGGMMLSCISFALLAVTMNGGPNTLPPIMAALVLLGIGQGLFTSPNNSAIMTAAPRRLGQAGGILNVMRSFGTGIGVACGSAVLTWRLSVMTGQIGHTLHAPPSALLSASRELAALFALFAFVAAALSASRPHNESDRLHHQASV